MEGSSWLTSFDVVNRQKGVVEVFKRGSEHKKFDEGMFPFLVCVGILKNFISFNYRWWIGRGIGVGLGK